MKGKQAITAKDVATELGMTTNCIIKNAIDLD